MPKKNFTTEQIISKLREAEVLLSVTTLPCQLCTGCFAFQ